LDVNFDISMVENDGLPQRGGEALRDQAREEIAVATGRGGNDSDRFVWEIIAGR